MLRMPLTLWIVLYVVLAGASLWITLGRNAEKFAGSGFLVFVLRDVWAGNESRGCLRAGGWIAFLAETVVFAYGVMNPEARSFWDLF